MPNALTLFLCPVMHRGRKKGGVPGGASAPPSLSASDGTSLSSFETFLCVSEAQAMPHFDPRTNTPSLTAQLRSIRIIKRQHNRCTTTCGSAISGVPSRAPGRQGCPQCNTRHSRTPVRRDINRYRPIRNRCRLRAIPSAERHQDFKGLWPSHEPCLGGTQPSGARHSLLCQHFVRSWGYSLRAAIADWRWGICGPPAAGFCPGVGRRSCAGTIRENMGSYAGSRGHWAHAFRSCEQRACSCASTSALPASTGGLSASGS